VCRSAAGGIGRGSFEKFLNPNTLARLGHNRLAAHHASLGTSPAIVATTTGGDEAQSRGSQDDGCEDLRHGFSPCQEPERTRRRRARPARHSFVNNAPDSGGVD
jgi:hypothetical protein